MPIFAGAVPADLTGFPPIYRRHRVATVSNDPDQAVEELFPECEVNFSLTRSFLNDEGTGQNLGGKVADEERGAPV